MLPTSGSEVAPAALHNSSTTPTPTSNCSGRSCPWWPYSSSQDFTSNAALILAILVSALLIALALNSAIRFFIRRRHTSPEGNDVEGGERKKDESSYAVDLEAFPKLVFSQGMKLEVTEATECAICLMEFVEGDVMRVLDKCNHGFHFICVHKWLVSHSSCPTCRATCSTQSVIATENDGNHLG